MKKAILIALALVTLVAAACGDGDGTADDPAQEPADGAANTLQVSLRDYDFEIEGEAQAGQLLLEFSNDGAELHHGIVARLDEGRTLEDVEAFLEAQEEGPPPPWFDDSPVDMSLVSPGETAGIVLDAEPGTYLLLCFMPDPEGQSHVEHGMYQTFEVGEGDAGDASFEAGARAAIAEDTVEAPSLPAGSSLLEVVNEGTGPGEVFVVRFEGDSTVDDIEAWFEGGQEDPAPASFFGGTHEMEPGDSVLFSLDLEPGEYALVSTFGEGPDRADTVTNFTVE